MDNIDIFDLDNQVCRIKRKIALLLSYYPPYSIKKECEFCRQEIIDYFKKCKNAYARKDEEDYITNVSFIDSYELIVDNLKNDFANSTLRNCIISTIFAICAIVVFTHGFYSLFFSYNHEIYTEEVIAEHISSATNFEDQIILGTIVSDNTYSQKYKYLYNDSEYTITYSSKNSFFSVPDRFVLLVNKNDPTDVVASPNYLSIIISHVLLIILCILLCLYLSDSLFLRKYMLKKYDELSNDDSSSLE